jgi:Bacterial Ig domain
VPVVRLLVAAAAAALLLAAPAAAASDPTAPQIFWGDPQDGGFYVQGQQVSVGYACVTGPEGVGVISCVGDAPSGSPLDTATSGTHTFTVRAEDFNGAVTTETHTYTVVDVVPPRITVAAPLDGGSYEVGSTITVSYSCDDPGGSGVVACFGSVPSGMQLTLSQLGTFTLDVQAFDAAGNSATTTVRYTVADTTPPVVTIATPADGASYTLGQQVTIDFSCSDPNGSGVHFCGSDDGQDGSPLDTSTVGLHSFTVESYDHADNEVEVTHTYRVVYPFAGFFSPLTADGSTASVKAGTTVPVKFSLTGDRGLAAVAGVSSAPVDCTTGSATGAAAAASGTVSYSAKPDRYTFQWATDRTWVGSCRALQVALADGTMHRALLRFTK